jgi:hypothetical protein
VKGGEDCVEELEVPVAVFSAFALPAGKRPPGSTFVASGSLGIDDDRFRPGLRKRMLLATPGMAPP